MRIIRNFNMFIKQLMIIAIFSNLGQSVILSLRKSFLSRNNIAMSVAISYTAFSLVDVVKILTHYQCVFSKYL